VERVPGVTGVVLAGGMSIRMGRDKALLPVGGTTLLAWQGDRLARVFDPVVISAKGAMPPSKPRRRVILDGVVENAAIYGLRAALRALRRPIFVLAVDLPLFPESLAAALARELVRGNHSCVAPSVDGVIQGLSAAYAPSALPVIESQIGRGRLSIRRVVTECGGEVRGESFWSRYANVEAFANGNRPEDYEGIVDG
jgi:molybdopterin-guanine dinucleotide biosynthesis protein A